MSNRYHLVKEYPGSPKLESIVKLKDNGGYELENSTSYFMTKDKVENYPEFWELVVEKDYKILSIIWGSKILKDTDNLDAYNNGYTGKYEIHSVKRLSDGEIFTIGDKVIGYNNSITKIKTIDLVGEVSLNIGTDKHEGFSLKNLKKPKQPLFTTEDGVDIFEGDKYYPVNKTYWIVNEPENTCKINYETYHKNTNNFSTKEKAEEYILMNKPVLSLKEIKETTTIKGLSLKKLEKLVQQKLKS